MGYIHLNRANCIILIQQIMVVNFTSRQSILYYKELRKTLRRQLRSVICTCQQMQDRTEY